MNYYNYFTEIEEHFVRRRGKHLYISPLDWSLIATWRDSGVPLHVALRGIDRAMDAFLAKRSGSHSKVSSLFYCHSSVMEEYAHHLESHLGEEAADTAGATPASGAGEAQGDSGAPDKKAILDFLNSRISEIKALPGKLQAEEETSAAINRIAGRLEEIADDLETDKQVDMEALDRDLSILDVTLVDVLRSALTAEQVAAWQEEARKELKVYRKKLPKDTYVKIQDNFLRTKTHRHFGVGELSLFHL